MTARRKAGALVSAALAVTVWMFAFGAGWKALGIISGPYPWLSYGVVMVVVTTLVVTAVGSAVTDWRTARAIRSEHQRIQEWLEDREDPPYEVYGDWIVAEFDACNCVGGDEASSYAHEPHCGLEPVVRISELQRLGFRHVAFDPVIHPMRS